jgi:hypothetical protein
MKGWALLIAVTFLFAATPAAAQSYEFSVEHEHTLRSCRGTLVIRIVQKLRVYSPEECGALSMRFLPVA